MQDLPLYWVVRAHSPHNYNFQKQTLGFTVPFFICVLHMLLKLGPYTILYVAFLFFLIRKRCWRSQRKALVLHLNTSTCTSVSEGWREKEIWRRRRMGRGTNTSGIRSGVLLNSCPSFQIRGAWVFHHSVGRTGKTGGSKPDEEECNIWNASSFLRQEETNRRFSKCFTASLLFPTHQGFNSEAAEVISNSFWFINFYKVT